jgi:hypothetical protein
MHVLHEAARKGDLPEAKKLLEANADLTARGSVFDVDTILKVLAAGRKALDS